MSNHMAFVSECLDLISEVNGAKDICKKSELLTKLAEADPHRTHCFAPKWQKINYGKTVPRCPVDVAFLFRISHNSWLSNLYKNTHTYTSGPLSLWGLSMDVMFFVFFYTVQTVYSIPL